MEEQAPGFHAYQLELQFQFGAHQSTTRSNGTQPAGAQGGWQDPSRSAQSGWQDPSRPTHSGWQDPSRPAQEPAEQPAHQPAHQPAQEPAEPAQVLIRQQVTALRKQQKAK